MSIPVRVCLAQTGTQHSLHGIGSSAHAPPRITNGPVERTGSLGLHLRESISLLTQTLGNFGELSLTLGKPKFARECGECVLDYSTNNEYVGKTFGDLQRSFSRLREMTKKTALAGGTPRLRQ